MIQGYIQGLGLNGGGARKYIFTNVPSVKQEILTQKTPPSIQRNSHGVCELNGKIYVISGFDVNNGQSIPVTECYDPVTDKWANLAACPVRTSSPACVAVGGKIYVIGGMDTSGYVNTNRCYDPATNSWTTKAAMPTVRSNMGVAVVDGKIYVMGGYPQNGVTTNKNECYDPATNSWTTKAVMPTARTNLSCAAVGGKIYAMGGNVIGGTTDKNECYDPATNSWTTKANVSATGTNPSAAVIDDKIHVANIAGRHELYDPVTDKWTVKLSFSNSYISIVGINGKIYGLNPQSKVNEEYVDQYIIHKFSMIGNNKLSFDKPVQIEGYGDITTGELNLPEATLLSFINNNTSGSIEATGDVEITFD